jgi:hypothetical protein
MSTQMGPNALRANGKMAAGALIASLCLAAAPAPKVVAQVKADFNGDGRIDRAALESTGRNWRLVAYLDGLGAKGVIVIDKAANYGPEGLYLETAKPGLYTPLCELDDASKCPKPIRVRFTAIDFSGEEGPSQVIYWDGQRFRTIQQGD